MNKLLTAVCAAAGGLLVGLMIASICGGSATRVADLIQERDGLLTKVRTLEEVTGGLRERLKDSEAQISDEQAAFAILREQYLNLESNPGTLASGTNPEALKLQGRLVQMMAERNDLLETVYNLTENRDAPLTADQFVGSLAQIAQSAEDMNHLTELARRVYSHGHATSMNEAKRWVLAVERTRRPFEGDFRK